MKRFLTLAAIGAGLALGACGEPERDDEGLEPTPPIEAAPPPVEPAPVPTETPAPTPPTDTTALPDDKRSSEETVQPESETLFY
ncbi:hypothetical protein [Brevundimonas sp.]|jgi:hypothetical protein|uniref:hypothetical protein n=1 Tax=Brevundimonas sp. TaxID=1871086 RepID=UPI002E12A57C|nr:hypothetical protein [Brevundimonas sp.]